MSAPLTVNSSAERYMFQFAEDLYSMKPSSPLGLGLDGIVGRLLDMAPQAFLLGDAANTILYANSKARQVLATGDGLQLAANKLVTFDQATAKALKLAWSRAGYVESDRKLTQRTQVVSIERPSGLPAYQLTLGALEMPVECEQDAIIALQLFDPSVRGTFNSDCLNALYGLTQCEADVAIAIAQGKDIATIASESGRAISTARNLLKRAMAKTGTSRQHELAVLLWHGAAGPLARSHGI